MKRSMQILIVAILLIFVTGKSYSQSDSDCTELLQKKIELSEIVKNRDVFVKDFKKLMYCEADSIDSQIFTGPKGDMSVIFSTLIALSFDTSSTDEEITFADLLVEINKLKQSNEYLKVRKIVETSNQLALKQASLDTWDEDEKLLEILGLEPSQIEEIYKIVKKHNNKIIYQQVFSVYSANLEDGKNKPAFKEENSAEKNNPDMTQTVEGLYAYTDYEEGLKKAKETGKTILLYFNGYACVNCRKIEDKILINSEIKSLINKRFIFIDLKVDDRTLIGKENIHFSETLKKDVQTIGDLNSEIEIRDFNANAQPLFVILNSEGKELARAWYTIDTDKFRDFLRN